MEKGKEQADKGGIAERILRSLRDLHIVIGAAALTGAVLFPQFVALPAIAAYEGVNAFAHDELRKTVKRRNKS